MKAADQKLFDAILSGQFNIQDKAAFEERLKTDTEFKADWELYQSMDDFLGVQEKNEEALAALKEVHAQNKEVTSQATRANKFAAPTRVVDIKSSRRPWMIAVSTIIVLGLASYLAMSLFTKPGLADYASSYEAPIWPIERGEATEQSILFAAFLESPSQSKIDEYHQLGTIAPFEKNYWLAEMHLVTGQADSCLYYINQAQNNIVKKDRLRFLEALAYLKTKDTQAIEALLKSLPRDFDPYYRQKMELFLK